MPDIKYAQTEAVDKGSLKVEVLANRTRRPIEGAKITISYSGKPDSTVEEVSADDSGMSEKLTLDAPPLEYSMEPSENQPFAQYTVKVTAPGYRPVSISGVQVFSEQLALQQVRMALFMTDRHRIPMRQIIMSVTGITSKMWHPARYTARGRTARCVPISLRSCPLR